MKRYFDLNLKTDNNFCDAIDPSYMVEIPNDGKPYGLVNNKVVDISKTPDYIAKQLEEAKEAKLAENTTKRDARLIGGVTYKNVLFDSDTDQKINLMFAANSMNDTDKIIWLGKNNDPLECTKSDILAIGGLISELTQKIWSELNPQYTSAIDNAKNIDELNAIKIDYTQI